MFAALKAAVKPNGTSRVVGYTEFCQKALDLFAAFELAAMYHHDVHINLDGRFASRSLMVRGLVVV